jgi:SHS2 domain-containing protein
MLENTGFPEVPHTADWAIRVWAPDQAALFVTAAQAMNSMAGIIPDDQQKVERTFEVSGQDAESLLVSFLSELVYLYENERLVFSEFDIQITGDHMTAKMTGHPILSINKVIKAVTYHNLQIQNTPWGLVVEIVFDV